MKALGVAVGAFCSALGIGIAVLASCASPPDKDRLTTIIGPDLDTYITAVDPYLNRRCGTLDCHGQAGRGYRMYSREGFRLYTILDASLISGVQPTTKEEALANYQTLVALEPEEMSRLMARRGEDPTKLLFLRKPLQLERHKGGPSMAEDDPGYRCVEAWLKIPVVQPDGTPIPPANRAKLSDTALQFCKDAAAIP